VVGAVLVVVHLSSTLSIVQKSLLREDTKAGPPKQTRDRLAFCLCGLGTVDLSLLAPRLAGQCPERAQFFLTQRSTNESIQSSHGVRSFVHSSDVRMRVTFWSGHLIFVHRSEAMVATIQYVGCCFVANARRMKRTPSSKQNRETYICSKKQASNTMKFSIKKPSILCSILMSGSRAFFAEVRRAAPQSSSSDLFDT